MAIDGDTVVRIVAFDREERIDKRILVVAGFRQRFARIAERSKPDFAASFRTCSI